MTGILYLLTCLLAIAAARVGGHDLSAAAVARRDAHAIRARGAMSKCSQKLKARELVEHRLARRAQLLGAHLAERRLQARAAGATDYPAQHPEDGYYPPPVVTNYSSSCILTPEILVRVLLSLPPSCSFRLSGANRSRLGRTVSIRPGISPSQWDDCV